MPNRTYFLGANTAEGFFSCYDSFCRAEDGNFLWIIKSGPGSGKSTLMRRIAAEAQARGYETETVLCSGDPDSLDGVYVPELHFGIVDGTAPHVIEPECIGAASLYLDLSPYYDCDGLRSARETLGKLFSAYRAQYRRAYGLLAAFPCPCAPDAIPSGVPSRFDAAICCRGVVRLENLSEAEELDRNALKRRLPEAAVIYRHPLWHTVAEGYEDKNGNRFRCLMPLPDCSEATAALQEAKRLHDALEAAYRAHIDFDGVTRMTETLIERLFK